MSNHKEKKKQTPLKEANNTQVTNASTVSSKNKKNSKVESKDSATKNEITKPIVDRFDFQILIAIIGLFASVWALLKGVICDFTESDPIDLQMSYIFVHYVLTVALFFSVVLSAMKSIYLINNKNKDYSKWFNLFLDSWFGILLVCLINYLFPNAFPKVWLFFSTVICLFIIFRMIDLKFSKKSIFLSMFFLIIGFPLFLSIMTSTIVNVKVETDKPFYSFSDKVLITVSARGYACKHKCVGLKEEYVKPKDNYDKELIVIDANQIKNNEVNVGTISPATGFFSFAFYLWHKMNDIEPSYCNDTKFVHYTPIQIYVKPQ